MLDPLLTKLNGMRVILATTSKQRQDIVRTTRLNFEVCASDFEENLNRNDYTFSGYVEETALNKVKNVSELLKNETRTPDLIIGLDTMVTFDGDMYGKPKDEADAKRILKMLTQSGLPHCIYTGVAVKYHEIIVKFTDSTTVYMERLTDEEIDSYISSGEPMGKAGAYAIQGIAGSFVARIDGDFNNVVGVPLAKLVKVLKQLIL